MPYRLPDDFRLYTPDPGSESLGRLEQAYVPAYKAWKAQSTPETRAAMLQAVQPVLSRAITTYGSGGGSALLKGHAKLLALDALPSYDPQRGRLDTHLLAHLQGLQRISGKQQQLIAIPERLAIDRKKLSEVETELEDQLGRMPTLAELQRATGLSRKRISVIRRVVPGTTPGGLHLDADTSPNELAGRVPGASTTDVAWLDFVHDDLPPVDQLIMERLFGMHGTPVSTVQQLAKRLGMTASAVSQRAKRIQELVDRKSTVFGAG